MILVVISLFGVICAWIAWRSNPLFSVRATLRFLVSTAAAIAAMLLATNALTHYARRYSDTVGLAMQITGVAVGCIAVVSVAVSTSMPRMTPLPVAATLLNVHRRRLYPWTRRLAGTLLVLASLALVLRGDAQLIAEMIGAIVGFVGILLLFAGWLGARRLDHWLSAVEADPWVRWTYTAEQWRRWIDLEVQRAAPVPGKMFHWRRDWKRVLPVFAAIVAGPQLLASGDSRPALLAYSAAMIGLLLGMGALGKRSALNAPAALRKKLVGTEPTVYFGRDGIFADGDFTTWLNVNEYLQAARLDPREPPGIALQFLKIRPGVGGTPHEVIHDVVLPLPEGRDVRGDLARLQKELRARCPSACVMLA